MVYFKYILTKRRFEQRKVEIVNEGVPVVAQQKKNPTRKHEVASLIPGLVQWVKDPMLP